jgi:hypothetical protein
MEHDRDPLLTAAFAQADTPAADETFVLRVMMDVERTSRARFGMRVLQSAAMGAGVGALLWFIAPVIERASDLVVSQAAVGSSPLALACGIALAALSAAGSLRFS